MSDVDAGSYFQVEGNKLNADQADENVQNLPSHGAFRRSSLPSSNNPFYPRATSSRSNSNSSSSLPILKKKIQYPLAIILTTKVNGKLDREGERITHVMISDENSNVTDITTLARQQLGIPNLVLVMSTGHCFNDCEALRTVQFWKATSRKVFAIREEQVESKKRKADSSNHDNNDILEIKRLIIETKAAVESKRDTELGRMASSAFRCLVRQEIAKSPISISLCCKQVLGCSNHVEAWLVNNTSCLHCRNESSTIQLNCFSEFLNLCNETDD